MDKNNEIKDEIKNYFTEEIRRTVREMTNQEMKFLLKSLEGTPTWIAILKYSQDRIAAVQDSFLILDPSQEVTKIARYQGAITGMLDLQDAVLTLKFDSGKKENPNYENEKKKNELGGAYGVI